MAANNGGWLILGLRANGESSGRNRGWADLSPPAFEAVDRLSVLVFELVPLAELPGTNTYLTAAQ